MAISPYLKTGIRIGVILILFTPLVLGPFGLSLSNYPKTVFFRGLVEIILIFYLILVFFDNKYLPKISILVLAVSIFVGVQLLAGLTGINFYRSFFGDLHRVEGVILYLHLLVFFLMLISIFQKKKDWLLFFKITVIVSAFSSLAGILQKLGIFKFYGIDLPFRISGTWTNPDFFAPYIVLAIFLGIFLLVAEKNKNWRAYWSSILILNFITLILSGTRASWIGFGVGMIFLFLFWFVGFSAKNPQKARKILLAVLILCIFLFLIILNQERLSLTENHLFKRAISIFDIETLLKSSRLPVWQIAIEAWKERPIFGWGPESFSYLFDKYFQASYLQYIPEKIHFDRPHNKILEVMTGSGIIGLLSYLLIFFAVFYCLNRYRRKNPVFSLILTAFFISYFVQNLFSFDTIGTYLLFFLVLGFINNNFLPPALWARLASMKSRRPAKIRTIPAPKFLKLILICPLIFLCLMAFYYLNVKPTLACRAFVRAVGEERDFNKALGEYKKGISKSTIFDDDFREELAARLILILDRAKLSNEMKIEIVKTLKELKPLLEKQFGRPDRRYLDPYRLVALINERVYLFERDAGALEEVEAVSKQALSFNPQKAEFYRLIGKKKIFQGNYSEGEAYFQKSFEISLKSGLAAESEFYRFLALAYYQAGQKPKAAEYYKKALDRELSLIKFSKPSLEEIQQTLIFGQAIAQIYYEELSDKETALEIYQKAKEIFPKEIDQYQFPVTD